MPAGSSMRSQAARQARLWRGTRRSPHSRSCLRSRVGAHPLPPRRLHGDHRPDAEDDGGYRCATPSIACSASRPTGTPTALPARRCARSRAACGRSICSTTRSSWRCCRRSSCWSARRLLLGWYWPLMGLDHRRRLDRLRRHRPCCCRSAYVAPAASLANAWDTKLGGSLADAISCNAVVKGFGAERREDDAPGEGRRQMAQRAPAAPGCAAPSSGTAQGSTLLVLRAAVVGFALCPLVERAGECRRHRLRTDLVLRAAGLSARCRHARPQPPALGQRHGGTGRHRRPAARRRRPARTPSRSLSATARSASRT